MLSIYFIIEIYAIWYQSIFELEKFSPWLRISPLYKYKFQVLEKIATTEQ